MQILHELTRRGYVTMRVEKTSMGDSGGPPCYSEAGDLAQEVDGYRAGFRALAQHPSVDPGRIVLFGHSAGATLAPLVARGLNVAGIVGAGAMGTTFHRYILAMRERERRLEGRSDAEVQKSMAITTACLDRLLIKGEAPGDIESSQPECRKQVRFDSPPSYIAQWTRLDLAEAWTHVRAPVLILYGAADFVTSEDESRALVEKINAAAPSPPARLEILPMDHGFLAFGTAQRAWNAEQGIVPPAGVLGEAIDSIDAFFRDLQRR